MADGHCLLCPVSTLPLLIAGWSRHPMGTHTKPRALGEQVPIATGHSLSQGNGLTARVC